MTTKDETLGGRLGALREKRELSQAQLAELSGVSQAQISLIEGGERPNPGVLTLGAIARALDIELGYLLPPKPRRARRKVG